MKIGKPEMPEIKEPGDYLRLADGGGWVRYEGLEFWEHARQVYGENNCIIASGQVDGCDVPEDTIYLWMEKDGFEGTRIVMRPDEAAAIIRALSSALWAELCASIMEGKANGNKETGW
jgi:hypothetical protein